MAVSQTLRERKPSKTLTGDTEALSKAERKRIQNRLNQKAYRQREAARAAAFDSNNAGRGVIVPNSQLMLFRARDREPSHKQTRPASASKSFAGACDDSTRNKPEHALIAPTKLIGKELKQDCVASVCHDASLPGNARIYPDYPTETVLQELNSRAHNIPVPKQVYWEWAVYHPETLTEEEIQRLQNISGLTGFNQADTTAFRFPISLDHKIMIVQYNLYRAMKMNKDHLSQWLPPCPLSGTVPKIPDGMVAPCLQSTALQQILVHPPWIAIFPHPKVRDNIILRQTDVCWDDMMQDLSGYLYPYHTRCDRDDHHHLREDEYLDPSDIANAGHGLIVWGEPSDIANWELTPAFIRKWRWTLRGCRDMIDASNRWRALRHEPPILEEVD